MQGLNPHLNPVFFMFLAQVGEQAATSSPKVSLEGTMLWNNLWIKRDLEGKITGFEIILAQGYSFKGDFWNNKHP